MPCPCGLSESLADCCARFIAGDLAPDTAEALMRSRYTAFATHAIDYLVATHHPDTLPEADREKIKRFSEGATWSGLEILDTEGGHPGDQEGWVEFIARYTEDGEARLHHERSLFRRHQGRWFFHSGHQPKAVPTLRAHPKTGRNDPCPCGSGKKYKKCCASGS